MSASRRSRALPTDGPGPKFLYAILKQLDLKSIDWSLVASELEISNGHAARMRYSRFRQNMEGSAPKPRESRAKKPAKKSSKTDSCKADKLAEEQMDPVQPKPEPKPEVKQERDLVLLPSNPLIKTDPYGQHIPSLADIPQATPQMLSNTPFQMSPSPYSSVTVAPSDLRMYAPATTFPGQSPLSFEQIASHHHFWAPVKAEPEHHGGIDDGFVVVEKTEEHGLASQRDEVEYQGTAIVGMDIEPVEGPK